MRRLVGALAAGTLLLGTAGCGGASDSGGERTLTVFAAASLSSSFEKLATEFERGHEGVDVRLSFGGSSDLVAQIEQGAPADVLASADEATMNRLVEEDLVEGDPVDFASNTLEIAVPPGNPAGVEDLRDLAKPGLNLVVCAPAVPCGAATRKVVAGAGLQIHPVSEEQSVTDVLNKVASREADAGLVYVTDVLAAGDSVDGIELPEAAEVVNTYPIAVVAGAPNEDLGKQWISLVRSPEGRRVLRDAGFGEP